MDERTLDDIAGMLDIEAAQTFTPPYAKEMRELGERILNDINSTGKMDTLEEAGRSALAILLNLYAAGELPPSESIKFLKSLVEKKTPPPIQRIEQRTELDMRVLISKAVDANPDKLRASIALAESRKEEVKSRLRIADTLELDPVEIEDIESELPTEEPLEISKLRGLKLGSETPCTTSSARKGDRDDRPSETRSSFRDHIRQGT